MKQHCTYDFQMTKTESAQAFIERWQGVTASEFATAQSFVMELCELLDVPNPHPTPAQDYAMSRLDWSVAPPALPQSVDRPPLSEPK